MARRCPVIRVSAVIETPRLWLRPWRQEDLPGVTAILADPEVMAFSDNGPLHPEACQRWLAQQIADRARG
ncbi:MAG: GNAT family N-acetyltransferase [Pseudomonadota bacterium]